MPGTYWLTDREHTERPGLDARLPGDPPRDWPAHQVGPLPDIQRGDIAVRLQPVATGMAAPDYAISPPGTSRLFVVEQNGLLRVIQNGGLLAAPALDIQSRVAPPLNPANANDERGFLGLAFHPGFSTPASLGYRHAVHVPQRADPGRDVADLSWPPTTRRRTTRTSSLNGR